MPDALHGSKSRLPLRATLAVPLYRRSSLPFRLAFTVAARLRSASAPRHFSRDPGDRYLAAHTKNYFAERWLFGYHRVFNLLSHFHPETDLATLDVLSLGPRTEIELYYLWLFAGFSWRRIVGADLVSFSPKIQLADFSKALPFPDRSFDVIVASHCLEKSGDPAQTRDEIRRVARPGAWLLVSGDRVPLEAQRRRDPETSIPSQFFLDGARGFASLYDVAPADIEYLEAQSPHGFDIIIRVR